MPRDASRINLEIKGVRVERLQDISDEDAIAEGIEVIGGCLKDSPTFRDYEDIYSEGYGYPINSFQSLWNSINESRGYGWDVNPWVWVIEFEIAN